MNESCHAHPQTPDQRYISVHVEATLVSNAIAKLQNSSKFCPLLTFFIPIRDSGNDYCDFDEKNYMIVGRRHHTKYQLGDPLRIQVAHANVERKQLDFTLADD